MSATGKVVRLPGGVAIVERPDERHSFLKSSRSGLEIGISVKMRKAVVALAEAHEFARLFHMVKVKMEASGMSCAETAFPDLHAAWAGVRDRKRATTERTRSNEDRNEIARLHRMSVRDAARDSVV